MSMRDLSEIKVRPPRSVAEGARWIAITVVCVLVAYFVIAVCLVLTGVWGGE
jgi:hypothetical protein